jgi:hypothetical protein
MAFGALVIFSIFTLITNRTLINNKKLSYESQFIISASSLAQSVIEEAKNKAFDEKTISTSVTDTSGLTNYSVLGPELTFSLPDTMSKNSFKSAALYNDIDDYNKYRRIVNDSISGNNSISVKVFYVDISNPDDTIGTTHNTWYKKMMVTVNNPFISIPIELTYIFSYY